MTISTKAQSLRFADTHPVNNPDSLERWLQANPKATALLRLKNLIALERTHDWLDIGKMGRYLPQLYSLAIRTKNPTALAAWDFLKAEKAYLSDDLYTAIQHGSRALNRFEKLNDVSGQVNTHCLLFAIKDNRHGEYTAADSTLTELHWQQSQQLLTAHPNPHDQVFIDYVAFNQAYIQTDKFLMKQIAERGLRHIITNPSCSYARRVFEVVRGVMYYRSEDFRASYTQNKKLLTAYPTTDAYDLAALYYNLGNDCLRLNRLQEGLAYYQQSARFSLACIPVRFVLLVEIYQGASELAAQNGLFNKAYTYLKQAKLYEDEAKIRKSNQQMQAFQARYEFSRRQQENDQLRQQQQAVEFRNWVYLISLGVALLIISIITLLAMRLRGANTQLTQALTEVQQLTKAREHFIAIIAHDLRKPLISFQGLADLVSSLLREGKFDQIRTISKTIDASGAQIETMLDNILKWALTEREAIPYNPASILLLDPICSVVSLYQNLTKFSNLNIQVNCPPELRVYADADALRLVVRNLLDNALKHLSGGGQIVIEAQALPTKQVAFRIQDTGRGMSAARLAYLQAVLSGSEPGNIGQHGLGFGLLLVRDFVGRNGGRVEVVSEIEGGTAFVVTLPGGRSEVPTRKPALMEDRLI